ncbi:hypothetical protein NUZ5A_20033 [Candidatus Nitrosotenuis uzonensis]|uniref:Uncharacterized protein n=1 Tax=Candidatus Nitrosotenuis uzonensis TaxID=1407055 RepID=A0A812F1U1_9ARCH|nr:hypothetical protein NUZ5A_20033 [Candidatus Nitrosotenuis uzonensis]
MAEALKIAAMTMIPNNAMPAATKGLVISIKKVSHLRRESSKKD